MWLVIGRCLTLTLWCIFLKLSNLPLLKITTLLLISYFIIRYYDLLIELLILWFWMFLMVVNGILVNFIFCSQVLFTYWNFISRFDYLFFGKERSGKLWMEFLVWTLTTIATCCDFHFWLFFVGGNDDTVNCFYFFAVHHKVIVYYWDLVVEIHGLLFELSVPFLSLASGWIMGNLWFTWRFIKVNARRCK